MYQKRGILLVVLVLFLVIPLSLTQDDDGGEVSENEEAEGEAPALGTPSGEDYEPPPIEAGPIAYEFYHRTGESSAGGCENRHVSFTVRTSPGDCSGEWSSHRSGGTGGCAIRTKQSGWDVVDEAKCTGIGLGARLTHEYSSYRYFSRLKVWGAFAQCTGQFYYNTPDGSEYMCADDYYWHKCGEDEVDNVVAWISERLYRCVKDETDLPRWEYIPGEDVDRDGYTTADGDCDDNPTNDPLYCSEIESREDCNPVDPKHYKCAICINPIAPEVCGDLINNDCGGTISDEEVDNLEGNTPDSCDDFPAGCEQRGRFPEQETRMDLNQYETQNHLNIHNQAFSWRVTREGGKCCGINGFEDLGTPAETDEGEIICLNKNLVRMAGGADISNSNSWDCSEDWCWVPAGLGDIPFKILTVNDIRDKPYDLVSNGRQWNLCQGTEGIGEIYDTDPGLYPEPGRFYCYDQGDRWSWADCPNVEVLEGGVSQDNGIKKRDVADGLFRLRVSTNPGGEIFFVPEYETYYDEKRFDIIGYRFLHFRVRFTEEILPPANILVKFKGQERMVREGQETDEFFSEYALSYAVNNPLLEPGRWIHVKMPIPEPMLGVEHVSFTARGEDIGLGDNVIELDNVYLSRGSSRLCSGEASIGDGKTAWFEDVDMHDSNDYNAINLCNKLYSPGSAEGAEESMETAWLGEDVRPVERRCCGNQPGEYYDGIDSDNNYGCWNSQPIAPEETTMNVEFQVQYEQTSSTVDYADRQYAVAVTKKTQHTTPVSGVEELCPMIWCQTFPPEYYRERHDNLMSSGEIYTETPPGCHIIRDGCSGKTASETGGTCTVRYGWGGRGTSGQNAEINPDCDVDVFDASYQNRIDNYGEIDFETHNHQFVHTRDEDEYYYVSADEETFGPFTGTITLADSPLKVGEITLNREDFIVNQQGEMAGSVEFSETGGINFLEYYYVDPFLPFDPLRNPSIPLGSLPAYDTTFFIMAELRPEDEISGGDPNIQISSTTETSTETFTYVCSQEEGECLYPLPGDPPYKITNPHPDVYELYFVDGRLPEDETLITQVNQQFNERGNIKAKKVAQQVIFVNPTEEEVIAMEDADEEPQLPGFYGCQAADYIGKTDTEGILVPIDAFYRDLPYCSFKGGHYCAYSSTHGEGRGKFTTINSWSDQGITEIGYGPLQGMESDLTSLYATWDKRLHSPAQDFLGNQLPFMPKERNYSAIVLPARNFISNAEFQGGAGNVLPHWETSLGEDVRRQIQEETLTLQSGEFLRSERVAVPKDKVLSLSQEFECGNTQVFLIDNDGNPAGDPTNLAGISTGDASYAVIEFYGPCQVKHPMLQLLDDMGATDYYPVVTGLEDDSRRGIACCPLYYCWNGYACVEPMGSYTYLAEHIEEGRDYRCINGEWSHLPIKRDWNKKAWGFCEEEEQCFVMSSSMGALTENTADTFYNNQFPTCINDKEFIFDNYCEDGEWTSRTKFIASQLLDLAENEDYVLYCADYRDALINFENLGDRENYLGGPAPVEEVPEQEIPETILGPAEAEVTRTCYGELVSDLVTSDENTCINNVCVLMYQGKASFATTLNRNLTAPEGSFLFALNVPSDELENVCPEEGEGFVKCDLEKLGLEGDLWYYPDINAVVYGKHGVALSQGFFGTIANKIVELFRNFFGDDAALSDESKFIKEAQRFQDVYLLRSGDKEVRALQEIYSRDNQTLVAEYQGFSTPVCDYVNNINLPLKAQTGPLQDASGIQRISCSDEDGMQRIEMVEGLDFFWPQLTGKLRVQ